MPGWLVNVTCSIGSSFESNGDAFSSSISYVPFPKKPNLTVANVPVPETDRSLLKRNRFICVNKPFLKREEKGEGSGLKVLGINGSPRKKNTYRMIEMVMEGINHPEIEKEIITLGDYKNLKYCLGDCTCLFVPPGTCVQKDDVQMIQQKIIEADAYVLGSPVYIMQVSGQLKTLIDRCCSMAHRPPAIGKYAVVVAPIAAPAEAAKSTIEYMKSWMRLLGAWVIGELAAFAPHRCIENEDEIRAKAHELGAKLGDDLANRKIYPPNEEDIRRFNGIKRKVKTIGGPDLEYWKTHEWLDKDYFYEYQENRS